MELEQIIQELNRRFAQPLPDFYHRHLIFWHDEEGDFATQAPEMELDGAKVAVLAETNNFAIKKLLNVDDTDSNFLVYIPFRIEQDEDNWLLDMELYSEEFHADIISMWMDEMKWKQTPILRKAVKTYGKFFNAKDRRTKAAAIGTPSTQEQVEYILLAVLCGENIAQPDRIFRTLLSSGTKKEENSIYAEIEKYALTEALSRMTEKGTGYKADELDLSNLASHTLLSATTRTMSEEILKGLEDNYSSFHQAYCYDLVADWLNDDAEVGALKDIALQTEESLELPKRFNRRQVKDLIGTDTFPCIGEIILLKAMQEVDDDTADPTRLREIVEKRRLCAWYDDVKEYYEGLLAYSDMLAFYKEHSGGIHTTDGKKLWKEYTEDYYQMDTAYRHFHSCFTKSIKSYHPELDDAFKKVVEKAENLYATWYLAELGQTWMKVSEEDLAAHGAVAEITTQDTFYQHYISSTNDRIYVIVSDALRYEVATQLSNELKRETKSQIKLSSVQAVFPTITKFGMAALLPHKELTADVKGKTEKLQVLIDGKSSEAPNRDKILKAKKENSVALKYKDLVGAKRAERQEWVKGMDVVYIYHDTIDNDGHEESAVFEACEDAIEEIKNIIRIITNEFGGANILVTADHGFLYTYHPLREDEKVDMTADKDYYVEIGRRYAILETSQRPDYLMPVLFRWNEALSGYAPREMTRIKMKGSGLNFVHGGTSLQEMVVPVLSYHHLRNASKEYQRNKGKYDTKPVEIALLSSTNKISNMIFSLNFYQKEAVGDNWEPVNYQLYFVDQNGKTVSDISKIIADRTSENGQERTFRTTFNLKSKQFNRTEPYYLIIADENGIETGREEFQIDIAFATDDFGF